MKEVKINGFVWYYDAPTKRLYEVNDKASNKYTELRFLTENEKEQLNMWLYYNGVPMISFNQ